MFTSRRAIAVAGILLLLLLGAIVAGLVLSAPGEPVAMPSPTVTVSPSPTPSPTPTPTPTPTPSPTPTPRSPEDLVARYERTVTSENSPEASEFQLGRWMLEFRDGQFAIAHGTFFTMGTYTATGSELVLMNDRGCPESTGTYRWTLEANVLTLEAIEDDCADGSRADDLTLLPWTRQS